MLGVGFENFAVAYPRYQQAEWFSLAGMNTTNTSASASIFTCTRSSKKFFGCGWSNVYVRTWCRASVTVVVCGTAEPAANSYAYVARAPSPVAHSSLATKSRRRSAVP